MNVNIKVWILLIIDTKIKLGWGVGAAVAIFYNIVVCILLKSKGSTLYISDILRS